MKSESVVDIAPEQAADIIGIRMTEFPAEVQRPPAAELATVPGLARMMDTMAADRAFNRAICR